MEDGNESWPTRLSRRKFQEKVQKQAGDLEVVRANMQNHCRSLWEAQFIRPEHSFG